MQTIPTWYIPSFFGDIRLTSTGESTCDVITTNLTSKEKGALTKLQLFAEKKKWIPKETNLITNATFAFAAPIDQVAKKLAQLLKPDRSLITAVKFANGVMEELRGTSEPSTTSTDDTKASSPPPEPVAAATVAAPVRGCPPPDFPQAEIRAQEVLRTFLTADQVADFETHQKFISIGHMTGNRYMVTSRFARGPLVEYTRSLYDLDRKLPICVHDWTIPPAEEMLTLHLLLQLPGWEKFLYEATEDNLEEQLEEHMRQMDGDRGAFNPMRATVRVVARRGLV
jgi:hypothetical protein